MILSLIYPNLLEEFGIKHKSYLGVCYLTKTCLFDVDNDTLFDVDNDILLDVDNDILFDVDDTETNKTQQ